VKRLDGNPSRIAANPLSPRHGSVAEWFKALVLKTSVGGTPPWVRIPPLPPILQFFTYISMHCMGQSIRGPHLGPHDAGASLMGGHEDHRNSADSIHILPPPIKKPRLRRPHPGAPPYIYRGSLGDVGILSQTNDEHPAAFETGVTGRG
jgi:hypothetical protein